MSEKVIIDIGKDGGTTVSVDGVKGEQCSTMSSGIIRALGGNVISDTPTDEMYEHPTPGQEVYQ
jgi:hypothetical protein